MVVSDIEKNEIINALDTTRDFFAIIGAVCQQPQLIRTDAYEFKMGDFHKPLQRLIFGTINNLIVNSEADIDKVTAEDIDNHLSSKPRAYEAFERVNGYEIVKEAIEKGNVGTFKVSYDRFKKYALLRTLAIEGIDVTELVNYKGDNAIELEEQKMKFDAMDINEVMDFFSMKINAIRDEWRKDSERRSSKASDNIATLPERLRLKPDFGMPFCNNYYNTAFRGMRRGKLMIRSADTGGGKTRQAIADLANISMDETWSNEANAFVKSDYSEPTLFISTELEEMELQTVLIAHVSGIAEEVIVKGWYKEGDAKHKRITHAAEIISRSDMFLEYIPDFSINDIQSMIESYIIKHNTQYIAFDYLQITPKLSRTIQASYGSTPLREDQILVNFTSALKLICQQYNVFIMTSTQVNRNFKNERDTNSLRGGSALADKADYGIISLAVDQEDLKNIKGILATKNWKNPNFCHHIYKNRGGTLSKVMVWTIMNLDTVHEEMMFVTDNNFNVLSTKPTIIKLSSDGDNRAIEFNVKNREVPEEPLAMGFGDNDVPPEFG